MWKKWLGNLGKSRKESDEVAAKRARHILCIRDDADSKRRPQDGNSFYSFEEDLYHHIRGALLIISTGIGVGFFSNPFVRDYLFGLNSRHQVLYRLKFMRLLRVIMDGFTEEISFMMTENYLEFGDGFVSSTSNFWSDPVRKRLSFGATIANFMGMQFVKKNGMHVFMSRKTHEYLTRQNLDGEVLKYGAPVRGRCQALVDFRHFTKPHTGANIGAWLEEAHRTVNCKPSYMYAHNVDGGESS